MLFLGLDVGSSSVKLSVIDGPTGKCIDSVAYPDYELEISSPVQGFAEQDPEVWWSSVCQGFMRLKSRRLFDPRDIQAIGISYQMHGLVLVDKEQQVLRQAIIWCDSRAISLGENALSELGKDWCFSHLLNSPGNFTASKLRWVQENQPEIFSQIYKIMLPGDFIAMKLSGKIHTTASGLSEGALWDFQENSVAHDLLNYWSIDPNLIPDVVDTFSVQSEIHPAVASELGLNANVVISYRAGDQPNNAFSLNVLQPGEVAATAGTSGVIYGVTDKFVSDIESRVNTFLHVNGKKNNPRNGVLVCVNGCGRSYAWLRQLLITSGSSASYSHLNDLASLISVGSDGVLFYPFGNGKERIFKGENWGANLLHLDFNRHSLGHIIRAVQEGIVFSLNQGFEVLKSLGGKCDVIRVSKGNLFLSDVFSAAFSNITQVPIEIYDTNGADGAARAAAIGCGFYKTSSEAFSSLDRLSLIEPNPKHLELYQQSFQSWLLHLPQ